MRGRAAARASASSGRRRSTACPARARDAQQPVEPGAVAGPDLDRARVEDRAQRLGELQQQLLHRDAAAGAVAEDAQRLLGRPVGVRAHQARDAPAQPVARGQRDDASQQQRQHRRCARRGAAGGRARAGRRRRRRRNGGEQRGHDRRSRPAASRGRPSGRLMPAGLMRAPGRRASARPGPRAAATSALWVTTRIVWPSAFSARTGPAPRPHRRSPARRSARRRAAAPERSPARGRSPAAAAARPTAPTGAVRSLPSRPSTSSSSRARSSAARRVAPPASAASDHVLHRRHALEQVEELEDEADRRGGARARARPRSGRSAAARRRTTSPSSGAVEAGDDLQQRGLAAAGRAGQRAQLARARPAGRRRAGRGPARSVRASKVLCTPSDLEHGQAVVVGHARTVLARARVRGRVPAVARRFGADSGAGTTSRGRQRRPGGVRLHTRSRRGEIG